ncbi:MULTISPECIES: OprD family outer membrane porin [unclassified Brenneria]|uniref:OprD family outer membrane porin n=1 Tax=unclassified Brenneria TaxID=2634434 RepID=UPI0015542742|nr:MULTISPECIES: OprD family outer membrane porin [unclassified Brenneria]MBJ7220996.1 OprD family outer membrane porin [Brenneria sp. L3-3C-1]MEE3642237.1 OprD family outer membrane porin [Brenneria sp. L3_3C_1]MEE3650391.1 OprD family outer membrane porin [Brenneria sp. HEZEL_4_2_4]NPD00347.1 outer membrane porin, OprD family [Brenneria sp. hezel4-2-4]
MKALALLSIVIALVSGSPVFAADNLKQAFEQGTLKGELRTYYFEREFEESDKRADLATGTLFYYHTAAVNGLSAGAAFASANDLGSNDDHSVYGLVKGYGTNKHQSLSRLQEYYIQGEWFDTKMKFGAQEANTPFMNAHDVRLMPKTYRGFSAVNNAIENLELSAYYMTDFAGWWDDRFTSLITVNGEEVNRDLMVGGVKYTLPFDSAQVQLQGWMYHMDDVFDSGFFKVHAAKKVGDYELFFVPSVLFQKSIGDELGGRAFDTYQYGFNTGFKAHGFNVAAFYAKTGDDELYTPWGDERVIIQQVNAAGRADETAYALRVAYDFSQIGIKGLSAYVFHAYYDTNSVQYFSQQAQDVNETDFSVQYDFSGALEGLSARVRYAIIDAEKGENLNDLRFYLRYSFVLGGK